MEIFVYFLIGMAVDRWLIPIIDMLLELLNYTISKYASGISLQTQREQLKFQKEVEKEESVDDPARIGFEFPVMESVCDDEDEIEERRRIKKK